MIALVSIHHKLHRWQQKVWAKIVLTLLLFVVIVAFLIPTLVVSYQLHSVRQDIFGLLRGPEQRIAAAQIQETGFIELRGVKIGDPRLKGYQILDENGMVNDPAGITIRVLQNEVPTWVPIWLLQNPSNTWSIGFLAIACCTLTVWLGIFSMFLYANIIAITSWYLFQWANAPNAAIAIIGMCLLGFSYHLIVTILQLAFRSPRQIPALARGVLLEAARTRLSIAFLTLLLFILPLIPVMLDPESPLRHRVQTMLSRSLGTTFTIAAFLTVFLGCATVAFEIRDRQIWQIFTKPVSRLGYMLGKWLGIVSLNFAILTISGLSVFLYLQYLRAAPLADDMQGTLDRLAVNEEILTARSESLPAYELLTNEQLTARVESIIEADPELRDVEQIQILLRQKLRQEVQETHLSEQRSIPPNRGGNVYSKTYRFEGLQHAKKIGSPLAFSYRFHIGHSDEHETFRAGLVYNNDLATRHVVTYVPTMTHVTMVPAYLIDDDGVITITIYNLYKPPLNYLGIGTMNFDKGGIELLYRVDDFEPNFFRAMLVLLIKLSFLAALALAASTFLSFPVACMVTLTIFVSGTLAPYLSESLQAYVPPPTTAVDFGNVGHIIQWAFENTIHAIATAIVFMLDGFGAQRPTDQLVQGMLVSWGSVLRGFLAIGIVWSGIAIAIGTIVLKKRQLAIYSGSG